MPMTDFAGILSVIDYGKLPPWALPVAGGTAVFLLLALGISLFGRRRSAREPTDAVPMKLHVAREDAARNGSGDERRRWFRRPGNPTAVLVDDAKRRAPPEEAWVVDRSHGGLCLLMGREVAAESRLKIRVANAAEHVAWLELRTIYVRSVGEKWQVGCAFVGEPELSVLLTFG